MPKLNSKELRNKRKILNWAGDNWHKLKEASKVKIWCSVYNKEIPTKHEGTGEDGEFVIRIKVGDDDQAPQEPRNRISEFIEV